MARVVQVKVIDGKQDTVDETRVNYIVGIPSDILFHTKDGIIYAQWWNTSIPPELLTVPVSQITSID